MSSKRSLQNEDCSSLMFWECSDACN